MTTKSMSAENLNLGDVLSREMRRAPVYVTLHAGIAYLLRSDGTVFATVAGVAVKNSESMPPRPTWSLNV